MAELDKFKRRMIRAVARLLLHEKKPEEEMWADLKQETGCDCKLLWQRMRALTVKKLSRLLLADDRVENIAAVAQLSHTDWLLFDLVLVHEKIDVISVSGRTNKTEYRPLVELFSLVQRFEIEGKTGDSLADAWSTATLHYNSKGHQVTPMLLQRRWYQLKEVSRDRFYKFWTTYRGNAKLLEKAKEHSPTALHVAVARRYPQIVVEPFPDWEEQIKNRLVILPEEFENKLRKKVIPKAAEAEDPDIVLMEPVIETIDLDADSDSEVISQEKPKESLESEPVFNIGLAPEISIKKEPPDDSCVDGLCNVKIVETTHITPEEESINFDDTPASKKHMQDVFRNVTENVEKEETQIEIVENDVANKENNISSDIVQKETLLITNGTAVGKILPEEKENTRKPSIGFLNFAKIDLAKVVAMVDDTGLIKQKKLHHKNNVTSGDDMNNKKKSMTTDVEEIVDNKGLGSEEPRIEGNTLGEYNTNHVITADNEMIADTTGLDKQILRPKSNTSSGDDTNYVKKSITIDLETIEDDTELDKQILRQRSNVPSADKTSNIKKDLQAEVDCMELINKLIFCKNDTNTLGTEAVVNDTGLGNTNSTNCGDTNNIRNSTKLVSNEIVAVFNDKKLSVSQTQNENKPSVDDADDVIEVKTDNCAIKLGSDELLLRDIKTEIKTENLFPEMPSEITLDDDGIEYVDDGIILLEEDEDNSIDTLLKTEPGDAHETPTTDKETNEVPKFDLKLLMDPVVYTTKIDHMNCLKFRDIRLITDVLLISNVVDESKPISKKSINVQDIKQADNVSQNSIVDEKRDNDDLFKKENIENEYEDEYGDECDSENDDEIRHGQKIRMSSCLLQKPRNRSYNPIQLCKNPDFNTRLKRLTVGFLSSNRNRQFLKACKPMTIDLCKGFESKLVNGTLYLKETKNVTTEIKESDNVSEQMVSVMPSAMPAQSLLDSTKISIDDLLTTTSTREERESKNKPSEKDNLLLGRNKVISLPDMDYVRRINQKLLTAEVTPIRINNNGSCAPPVQLLSSYESAECKARNNEITEDPCKTASISKDKLDFDSTEKSIEDRSEATKTDETHIQTSDPIRFEVFSHRSPQEDTSVIKIAQGKDYELRNIVEQRKNKAKGNQYNKLKKNCFNPVQVPWRPFHSTAISWSSQYDKYPEPDKYDFLLTTDTLLKVLKLLAGKEVGLHKKDKNKAKKLQKEFESEYINVGKDREKQNETVREVDEIYKKNVKKPKINIIERAEKSERTKKKKNNSTYCCWCREKMQFLKQGSRKLKAHLCPLPICYCCCKEEFFSSINFKDTLPNKSSCTSTDLFITKKKCAVSISTHLPPPELNFSHENDSHKDACTQVKNLTETVVLSDDEDSNVTSLTKSSTAHALDSEENSESEPNKTSSSTNDGKMQGVLNNIDQVKDLPTIKLQLSTNKNECHKLISTHPPLLVPFTSREIDVALCSTVTSQDENIQLNNHSQKIANEESTTVLGNSCVKNITNTSNVLLNIQSTITNATINERITKSIIDVPNEPRVTPHVQNSINVSNFSICDSSERLSPLVSVSNVLYEYSTPTDQQYEKVLSATHQQSSAVCNQQSHIVIDGTKLGAGPTIITQKMSGKDRVVYLNGQQISRSPTCSPIFLGKNKILLTSVKLPSKNKVVPSDNEIIAPEVIPTEAVPDGVHLIMLPTGQLTYTTEPGLELSPSQVASIAPILAAVQQQLDMALPSNLASNSVNAANIENNEVNENNTAISESNSNISENLDLVNADVADLNIQNSTIEKNKNLDDNSVEVRELNILNREHALEETSPFLEKSSKSIGQNNDESSTSTVSHNTENIDLIAESAHQKETFEETVLQDENELAKRKHDDKDNDVSKNLARIKINQNLQNSDRNRKPITDDNNSTNYTINDLINKNENTKQNAKLENVDCAKVSVNILNQDHDRDQSVTIVESNSINKDAINDGRKEELGDDIDDNRTQFTLLESNENHNKDSESYSQDVDQPIAVSEHNIETSNFENNIKNLEQNHALKNSYCIKASTPESIKNLNQVLEAADVEKDRILAVDDSSIGSSDLTNNSRKTILSDLMAMSGISSEDITPAPTSSNCQPNKESNVPSYVFQNRMNETDLIQLSPVTSLDELKYACDHNGKFYKLDLDTGVLVAINVCIKQKLKPISKMAMKMTFDPKSVIDLTNDMEISKSENIIKSRKPIRVSRKRSFKVDEYISSVKPLKMFKAIRPRILRGTETKSITKCDSKKCENRVKPVLKRRRKQDTSNQIEARIDLVDSDGPVEEEYLLDAFDSDSNQEKEDIDINRTSINDSDDSDDEPLAKKVMRNKVVAETLARVSGISDDKNGRSMDGYEGNTTENQVEPIIENVPVDMPVNSETQPISVDFLESDDETSQDDCILGF